MVARGVDGVVSTCAAVFGSVSAARDARMTDGDPWFPPHLQRFLHNRSGM